MLVLVAGGFQGVVLANLLGLVVTVVVFLSSLRHVEWRRGLLLVVPALLAVPVGAWVARTLPSAWLEVLVGGLVLIALVAVRARPELAPFRGRAGAVAAGATSGFMNVTAGVGGPAMVLYALGTKWEQVRFAATFQFYAIFVNLASLAAKGGPQLPTATLVLAFAGLAVGLLGGHWVARRVTPAQATQAVFALALLGAAATLMKGLWALVIG
ncbi:MAG TPA: TSUP family transporter [Dermatophilaceae bacterium]|nr:TSUP family transporter [Dermatophilaceae bacterium]